MKLLDFSRDSDVAVSINRANNGTYDVQFSDGQEVLGLDIWEAWLKVRQSSQKVPTKFLIEFATLAIQRASDEMAMPESNWKQDVKRIIAYSVMNKDNAMMESKNNVE